LLLLHLQFKIAIGEKKHKTIELRVVARRNTEQGPIAGTWSSNNNIKKELGVL
jgi:hypothetical protein